MKKRINYETWCVKISKNWSSKSSGTGTEDMYEPPFYGSTAINYFWLIGNLLVSLLQVKWGVTQRQLKLRINCI